MNAMMQVEPIMGAGYHTIHHTVYKHNYGERTGRFGNRL